MNFITKTDGVLNAVVPNYFIPKELIFTLMVWNKITI